MKLLPILFAYAACLIGSAAEAPNDATFADLAVPEKRLAAQQAILDHSRGFTNASPEAKAWFERVRTAAKTLENPEGQAALQQVLLFDPNLKPRLPLNPKQPNTYEDPEGTTPETKLAHLERVLDQRRSAKEYPLTVEELVALTKHEDFATAQRANRLLRRVSASARRSRRSRTRSCASPCRWPPNISRRSPPAPRSLPRPPGRGSSPSA